MGGVCRGGKFVLLLVLLVGVLSSLTLGGMGFGEETPEERCRRETAEYNQRWKELWKLSHPWAQVAPEPSPPYVCRPLPKPSLPPGVPGQLPGTPNPPNNSPDVPGPIPVNPSLPVAPPGQIAPGQSEPFQPGVSTSPKLAAPGTVSPSAQVASPSPPPPTKDPFNTGGLGYDLTTPGVEQLTDMNQKGKRPIGSEPYWNSKLKKPQQYQKYYQLNKPKSNGSPPSVENDPTSPPRAFVDQLCVVVSDLRPRQPDGHRTPEIGKAGKYTGRGGVSAADLGVPYKDAKGNWYLILGDLTEGQPRPGNWRGVNYLVPAHPDGTVDRSRPILKHTAPTISNHAFDPVRDRLGHKGSRLIVSGTVEVGGSNYVMFTPISRGLEPAGAGQLFALNPSTQTNRHIPIKGMDPDLPSISQISGFTDAQGYVNFITNNFDRRRGITLWRAKVKNFRNKNKWEWYDADKKRWIPYQYKIKDSKTNKPKPIVKITKYKKGTGEMHFVRLRDGSIALAYLQGNRLYLRLVPPGSKPSDIAHARTVDITPINHVAKFLLNARVLNQTYGPYIFPDVSSYLFIRFNHSEWNLSGNDDVYGIFANVATGLCGSAPNLPGFSSLNKPKLSFSRGKKS